MRPLRVGAVVVVSLAALGAACVGVALALLRQMGDLPDAGEAS